MKYLVTCDVGTKALPWCIRAHGVLHCHFSRTLNQIMSQKSKV